MSYSISMKEELIEGAPHARCCKAAYTAGLLYDAREMREDCLVLVLSGAAARRECARAFREQYRRTALLNGAVLLLASEQLYAARKQKPVFACPHCVRHFLRGLLISCGSVTDPLKGYHMELRLSDAEKVPFLAEIFESFSFRAGCRALKGGGVGVYFKNSEVIEEILTMLGANQALFALINAKIERNIRNEENRGANCETSNIMRAVGAAAKCCEAIERLTESGKLVELPAELQETARLRSENPDISLLRLAHLHNPPITKSGLNHRLQKLIAAAYPAEDQET